MNKAVYYMMLALTLILSLGCFLVSFLLVLGSGFAFFDIDYNEEQRQAAELYARLISLSGLIGLLGSLVLMGNSDRMTLFMMKLLRIKLSGQDLEKIDERSQNIL